MDNQNSLYKLDKLIEYVGNDQSVVKEMISLFIGTSTEAVEQMNLFLKEADFQEISKVAHKLKPNLDIFGVDDLHDTIRELEQKSKLADKGADLRAMMQTIQMHIEKVIEQMKHDFSL